MSDTPTPRTDAEEFEAWDSPRGSAKPAMDVVYADFARQLERENKALQEGLKSLCEHVRNKIPLEVAEKVADALAKTEGK